MTSEKLNCDPDALYAAIEAGIKAQFPALVLVEFDRDEKRPPKTPACLLEMSEFEPHKAAFDAGTGQLVVDMTFEARLILDFKSENSKRAIKKFAMAFAAWIHLRRWPGMPNGECVFLSAYPDGFSPELDQYETWRVTWEQKIFLGDTDWHGMQDPAAPITDEAGNPVDLTFWRQPHVATVKDGEALEMVDE